MPLKKPKTLRAGENTVFYSVSSQFDSASRTPRSKLTPFVRMFRVVLAYHLSQRAALHDHVECGQQHAPRRSESHALIGELALRPLDGLPYLCDTDGERTSRGAEQQRRPPHSVGVSELTARQETFVLIEAKRQNFLI